MIGKTLGPYQIVSKIGEGGMGVVYRAHDPRLGRDVALKVLPEDFACDAERRARFDREARAAASLSHPHIVSIFDFGNVDSIPFVVMELVRGKSLKELLVSGPLSIPDLLKFSMQSAYALAAAHEAGIVHRDLKPANIMVTNDGFIKLTDFGLAKIVPARTAKGELSPAPSTGSLTPALHLMGTPAYMSPEQAKGQPLDFRSDQFALGTILYEMATGKNPFARAHWAEELVAVCGEEPQPIRQLNPAVPKGLEAVVQRCLSKNPLLRYSTTREIAFELDRLRLVFTLETLGFKRQATALPRHPAPQDLHLHRVIGTASDVFPVRNPFGKLRDFAFGNLVADAMRASCSTRIAIINTEAFQTPSSRHYLPRKSVQPANPALRRIGKGYAAGPPYDLVVDDVLRALPFENRLVTRSLTGAQLHAVLDHSVSAGSSLQISGFRFAFDRSHPQGSRVLWARLDTGEPILPDETIYTTATIDFLNSGGDGFSMLADGSGSIQGPLTEAVIKHIESRKVITPVEEGRIVDSQA
jgi:serine/threonine protein kinase